MWHTALLLTVALAVAPAGATDIDIDPTNIIHVTDDHYLSFALDSGTFKDPDCWSKFDYRSLKLQNLMASLAPAIFRIGGTGADMTFFAASKNITNLHDLLEDVIIMTDEDWDRLNWLVRGSGLRLLFDLNMQCRFGDQWNPTNAIELIDYSVLMGYTDLLDFELGNEPNHGSLPDKIYFQPEQFSKDYGILHDVIKQYPELSESRLVGPDVTNAAPVSEDDGKILQNLVENGGPFMDALTFHHYYFKGPGAGADEYLNPKHFNGLADHIAVARDIIRNSSNPNIPYWIGETSDSYDSGTAGVSDRFVSGFLWLDKLGLSASMGVSVVVRQTLYGGNYALLDANLDPNPDYWLSLLFKKAVGTEVLKVISSNQPNTTRVYAHLTNTKNCAGPSDCYPEGSVTMFALNVNTKAADKLTVQGDLAKMMVDAYVFTAGDDTGPLAKTVKLNDQQLKLNGDDVPQRFTPNTGKARDPIMLPPLSYGFFVFYQD